MGEAEAALARVEAEALAAVRRDHDAARALAALEMAPDAPDALDVQAARLEVQKARHESGSISTFGGPNYPRYIVDRVTARGQAFVQAVARPTGRKGFPSLRLAPATP